MPSSRRPVRQQHAPLLLPWLLGGVVLSGLGLGALLGLLVPMPGNAGQPNRPGPQAGLPRPQPWERPPVVQPPDGDKDPNNPPPPPAFVPFQGHKRDIVSLVFARKAGTLISASQDGTVKVWDATGHEKASFAVPGDGDLAHLALSPAEDRVALAFPGGSASLAALPNGQPRKLPHRDQPGAALWSIVFSPDGKTLATAHGTQDVQLWEADPPKPTQTLKKENGQVLSLAFSPDGSLLAAGTADRVVQLWDVKNHQLLTGLTGHQAPPAPWDGHKSWQWAIRGLAFTSDGKKLASGGNDGTVRVWDVAEKKQLASLVHGSPVLCVAINPKATLLAAACEDGSVVLWDLARGERWGSYHKPPQVFGSALAVAFHPEGGMIALAVGSKIEMFAVDDLQGKK